MIKSIVASVMLVLAAQTAVADAMTAADVKRCNAMAATMAPKKAEIETLQAKRDEMAMGVEQLGEVWEDAEIHRLASPALAANADETKVAYQEARQKLMATEYALQALARQFNQDIASYNQSCATAK
jgi:hypothetical protein